MNVIKDFDAYIRRLNKGYQDSYQHILMKIEFIETGFTLDDPTSIYENLISND